jgi:hypothetical protein
VAKLLNKNFTAFSDLYIAKYNYDSKYWNNYDLLVDHPLPEQIKTDLEHPKKLEEQFVEAGK